MRFLTLLPLLVSIISAQSTKIEFINPESGASANTKNFALNPTYVIGSSLNIQWSASNNNISMVMYQERPGDNFEYIFQNSFDISSFRWTVGTQKNLSNGAVFFFQIFKKGETAPTASSRYFNLTRGRDEETTNTRTTSSATLSATPTDSFTSSVANTSSTGTLSSTPTNDAPPVNGGSNGGLGTGAKIGLGVGIPIAVILGLAAGWFCFGRKRKDKSEDYTNHVAPHHHENKYTHPDDGSYAPEALHEQAGGYYKPQGSPQPQPSEIYTPPTEPVEMPGQRYS